VHTGYEVRLWFATEMPCDGPTSTPDAWRFDTEGCQEVAPEIQITPPVGSCPAMWGTGSEPVSFRQVVYEPLDFVTPPGAMRAVCAVSYVGSPQTPDPGQRYFLFLLRFDHTNSVTGPGTPGLTCGGYETPMCFALWSGVETLAAPCSYRRSTQMHYSDTNLVEHPIEPGDHPYATFALDPAASMSCFESVSAQSRTWGAIKAQYR
jgi:hypothetical protein